MEHDEKSPEFGRYLRTHRRSKGISLEQVSQKTKITVASLKQLEDEELDKLPAPAFVKGFIRAYAEVVGVDVREAVRRYEEKMAPLAGREQGTVLLPDRTDRRPRVPMLLIGLGSLLVVALLFFVVQHFRTPQETPDQQVIAASRDDRGKEAPEVTPEPSADVVESSESEEVPQQGEGSGESEKSPVPEESPAVTIDREEDAAVAPLSQGQAPISDDQAVTPAAEEERPPAAEQTGEPFVLVIDAVERTWLRVTIDQETTREVTIEPRDRITLKAQKEFELFVGNAGGIELQLNGEAVDIPGESGQVAKLRLP